MPRPQHRRSHRLTLEILDQRRLLAGLTISLPEPGIGTAGGLVPSGPISDEMGGLEIVFNLGPNIRQVPAAVNALESAAAELESFIADSVTLFIDVEVDTLPDNALGGAIAEETLVTYNSLRPFLIQDAINEPIAVGADPSDPLDDQIVLSLPEPENLRFNLPAGVTISSTTESGTPSGVSVPINGSGGSNAAVGQLSIARSQLKALGILQPTDPTYLQPDASIVFSSAENLFDFNAANGIDNALFDFRAVAIHEIGHALGFIASTDFIADGIISPTILDLYRFPRDIGQFDPATPEQFGGALNPNSTGFPRELRPNVGAQLDFVLPFFGQEEASFPLADIFGGDQTGHFADRNALVETPIGILDPTLEPGVVGQLSLADLRAFDLIGWDIINPNQVPDLTGRLDPRANPLDVNLDGRVSAVDALIVINTLSEDLAASPLLTVVTDPNEDGQWTSLDALVIVNYLGSASAKDQIFTELSRESEDEDVFDFLGVDAALTSARPLF